MGLGASCVLIIVPSEHKHMNTLNVTHNHTHHQNVNNHTFSIFFRYKFSDISDRGASGDIEKLSKGQKV